MSPVAEHMTEDDLARLDQYLRDARRRMALGEAISKRDFKRFLRHSAAWLLDRFEDAWSWVRNVLGVK